MQTGSQRHGEPRSKDNNDYVFAVSEIHAAHDCVGKCNLRAGLLCTRALVLAITQ